MACKGFLGREGAGRPAGPAPGGAREAIRDPVGDRATGRRTAVWAHRGRGGGQQENTVEAFVWARRLGADGVELDVHLSADGELVVHHDAVVPGSGPVAELRAVDLPASVPLLADVLSVCQGMEVDVEIKSPPLEGAPRPVGAVAAAVVGTVVGSGWTGRVVLSSFSTDVLDAALLASRSAGAEVRLGWLVPPGVDPHGVLEPAAARGYHCVHPFVGWVDAALVRGARQAGLAINVWTVNAPADLRAMVGLGVDAVITDLPSEALVVAGGR
ncbi:MAG TPA: glycerophosphodiester phosphodiesterase [Acidimicrobiales bacterium]|nr:glycerophosphodiester phosphodiesterase [Acidimicrobiales bacterium]